MREELFNKDLCQELREAVTRTDIFYKDNVQSQKFEFICAFMDRFDFAVDYLNKHPEKPKTEIDFMTYLMQTSIVRDGIKLCYSLLDLKEEPTNVYFKQYCLRDIGCEPIDDDKYYEYLRSLAFAHPLNTSKSIPNRIENEKQFSPFCLLNLLDFKDDKDSIGVMVYSNKRESFTITIPFKVLIDYLKSRYSLLKNIINKFNEIVQELENNWKKRKVNRNQSNLDILKEIAEILEERYLEHDSVDRLIEYLETELTDKKNKKNVEIFRGKIIEIIPLLCDDVDEYKTDDLYNLCDSLLYLRPKGHQMMHYQLEKIFCYLSDDNPNNVDWGLKQAEAFSKEFAKKWVNINPYDMSFKEIRLLVTVACYLEYIQQNRKDVSCE